MEALGIDKRPTRILEDDFWSRTVSDHTLRGQSANYKEKQRAAVDGTCDLIVGASESKALAKFPPGKKPYGKNEELEAVEISSARPLMVVRSRS